MMQPVVVGRSWLHEVLRPLAFVGLGAASMLPLDQCNPEHGSSRVWWRCVSVAPCSTGRAGQGSVAGLLQCVVRARAGMRCGERFCLAQLLRTVLCCTLWPSCVVLCFRCACARASARTEWTTRAVLSADLKRLLLASVACDAHSRGCHLCGPRSAVDRAHP